MPLTDSTVLRADSNPYIAGAVTFASGTAIALSQSGQTITINSTFSDTGVPTQVAFFDANTGSLTGFADYTFDTTNGAFQLSFGSLFPNGARWLIDDSTMVWSLSSNTVEGLNFISSLSSSAAKANWAGLDLDVEHNAYWLGAKGTAGNGTYFKVDDFSTNYVLNKLGGSGDKIIYADNSGILKQVSIGSGLSFTTGTLTATGSGGTVTAVSVATANGFSGSSSGGTTPILTLSTTITGILQGNGTAISAATIGNLTDVGTDGIVVTGGTGVVFGSGTSLAQHVSDSSHNGYLSSTDWSTFNSKQSSLTFGNLTDVGTDGITITGGTGAVIGTGTSISQHVADTTHAGYLSSTDWNTFNGKQPSGTYVTSVSGTSNRITSTGGTTPVIDIASTYVGQSSITTLGTITTGVWTGTAIAVANGGTGGTSASITLFNNITGYTASGATGTTSTNLVFSTSPTLITPTLGAASATSLTVTGTAGAGFVKLLTQASSPAAVSGSGIIHSTSAGDLGWMTDTAKQSAGAMMSLSGSVLTADRIFTFPDKAGTVALITDLISYVISVDLATNAVLPNSPTYANGTAGVGATLTSTGTVALVVDGSTVSTIGQRVLVKTQASQLQNGIYSLTIAGGGGVAWVLTRTSDANLASQFLKSQVKVAEGTVNAGLGFFENLAVVTIGTDAINYPSTSGLTLFAATSGANTVGAIPFYVSALNNLSKGSTAFTWDTTNNRLGVNKAGSPTAQIHIGAGGTGASTAPLKFTSGTNNSTAEAGAFEYTTPQLFFTNDGAQRQEIPQIQQTRVTTQFDKTNDAALAAITGLTATLVAGKIYKFEANLHVTANVTGGSKYDLSGTATATSIIYEIIEVDNTTNANTITARGTALASASGQAGTTSAFVTIIGLIVCNAAGTFTPRFAQNAATILTTSSVLVGSTWTIQEMA